MNGLSNFFAALTGLEIPDGTVKRIDIDGVTVWECDPRETYQRVEYLTRKAGGGWFRTDFIADNQSGLELSYSVPSFSDTATMGSRASGSTNGRCYIFYPRTTTVGYIGWNTAQSWSVSSVANTKYTTRLNWLNSRKAVILNADGTTKATKSVSGTLVQQTSPIDICSYNNGNGRAMSLYGARLSKGSEIVREYIPCYRKSDGEMGLFETFTGQFIPSQVSGGFTKGPDVDWDGEAVTAEYETQ